jgi:hypothetical protein
LFERFQKVKLGENSKAEFQPGEKLDCLHDLPGLKIMLKLIKNSLN